MSAPGLRVDFAIPTMCPLSGSSQTCQFDVANLRIGVIQAPEPEPRIMRDMNSRTLNGPPSGLFCRTSPEACRRSTTDVSSTAFSGYCAPAHRGAICQRALGLARPNRFVRWRTAGIWDCLIMEALAKAHDGSVQMIDTSIVRVHQHGGCAGGGETRLMGRSRGGLRPKYMPALIPTDCPFAPATW
jgi:transposase